MTRQWCECDGFAAECVLDDAGRWCRSHGCPACGGGLQPACEFDAVLHPCVRAQLSDEALARVLDEWVTS